MNLVFFLNDVFYFTFGSGCHGYVLFVFIYLDLVICNNEILPRLIAL